jgi:predicted RNA binding protein YcfA (HicA-like mRNA interferase family)
MVVKRRDLEQKLSALGWSVPRHGGAHDIWGQGTKTLAVPRHNEINEINENTARSILRTAGKE